MWLQLLKGICSGLCPLLQEKLLPVGESGVKTVLGEWGEMGQENELGLELFLPKDQPGTWESSEN